MNTLKTVAQLRGQAGFFLRSISSSQGCYANYKYDKCENSIFILKRDFVMIFTLYLKM